MTNAIYNAREDATHRRHVIYRVCESKKCSERGKVYTSVYAGPANSHPWSWPVDECFCGKAMRVTRVEDLNPAGELAKALDRLGVIGARS